MEYILGGYYKQFINAWTVLLYSSLANETRAAQIADLIGQQFELKPGLIAITNGTAHNMWRVIRDGLDWSIHRRKKQNS